MDGTNTAFSFSYTLPTRIEFGDRIIEKLPLLLSEYDITKPFIITDSRVWEIPFSRGVEQLLREASLRYELFDKVEANPKDTTVHQAAEQLRKTGADGIIALGGGSPIDCAKAVSVTAAGNSAVRRYTDSSLIGGALLPIIAVPTTAGTGSEITFSSVITDSSERFKFTVKSPAIAPKAALLDPSATLSMPPMLTSATGIDALTHAVEAFLSKKAEPLADAMALYAVEIIGGYIVKSVEQGSDEEARRMMLLGSLTAGLAFSHSDVGAVHCIAEALGGMYDLPHGVCNSLFLSTVAEYSLDFCAERLARLARTVRPALNTVEDRGGEGDDKALAALFVHYLSELERKVTLPKFRDLGIDRADFPAIAEAAAVNGSNASNRRPMRKDDYMKLLERVWNKG